MSKTKTPNTKQAVIDVLKAAGEATVAQIAVSAGVGRSTAGKILAQLESDGEARRTEGEREGNRRQPDLWSLGKPPANAAGEGKSGGKASAAEGGKLKPNQLNPLVLGFLEANKDSGPYGPTQVAKELQRSSGAVGNCLERLRKEKKVKLVTEKPRRYSIA